ncbi:MAG TPA: OFA family MFS transporter [Polyangiaceae bacterium]|jgi:MFS family permease
MSTAGGSFLDRERTVAGPGYSRWLIPPAALAIHLCIGQGYALSVFNIPMSRLLGITKSTPDDWSLSTTVWMFNIAFAVLGASAFAWGKWLERVGPRKAMFASAVCFAGGFFAAAVAVTLHSLPLLYAAFALYGVGLGLGYISPVSTLIKWFPDRPGMATGMAIMGFGGGALIGSPLAQNLMDHFKSETSMGVAPTFVTMGVLYFVFMMFGVVTVRVPPPGYAPKGYEAGAPKKIATVPPVTADEALKTPQFWLLWAVLFLNVTAGIGVLSQASPMIQESFAGRVTPSAAAGFVGVISLFNLLGRFFWSSISDYIGRKPTYAIYFALGTALYCAVPSLGRLGSIGLFVAAFALIFTMYGGGFSTVPAYLRDLFGVDQVGAIHGRLLTAWSAAAIAGPSILTYMREYQLGHGVAKAEAYTITMYVMASLLVAGLVCNALVKPVDPKHHARA